jgi:hypothetical protein
LANPLTPGLIQIESHRCPANRRPSFDFITLESEMFRPTLLDRMKQLGVLARRRVNGRRPTGFV